MGLFANLFARSGGQLSDTGVGAALAAHGYADGAARAGGTTSLAAELRLLGLIPTSSPTPSPSAPIGFAANGAANAALKAMLARVAGGTGRGKVYVAGDSISLGQGAGTTADSYRLTGARANRWPAALAVELTGIGYPALDNSFVGDGGLRGVSGGDALFPAFEPRFTRGTWTAGSDQRFAGGATWSGTGGAIMRWTVAGADTFEAVYLNFDTATFGTYVDGANPVSGPASGAIGNNGAAFGLTRVTVKGASASGAHYAEFGDTSGSMLLASMTAYAAATRAIDVKVGAACGATSAQLASSNHDGGHWDGLDYLAFEAPDLTIVLCGVNDMAAGVSTSAFAANLQAIITRARLSGDVLLCFPHANQSLSDATYQAYNAAAKALAASAGVAFMSFYEYFGAYNSTLGARTADGTHPLADMAAEIGQAVRRCIQVMAT